MVDCYHFLDAFAVGGIPVYDGTSDVYNTVQQLIQLKSQYDKLVEQVTTAKETLTSMTGSRGMGLLLNNPEVQALFPKEFQDLLNTIKQSSTYDLERAKFPTVEDPNINAIYDAKASTNATLTDFFKKTNDRIKQISDLQGKINEALDPAAKQDLANRISIEQVNLKATAEALLIAKAKMEKEEEKASRNAAKSFICKEFKSSDC